MAVCSALVMVAVNVGPADAAPARNPALVIPRTFTARCAGHAGPCTRIIPESIRRRIVRFPKVAPGDPCPTSGVSSVDVPGASGMALQGKVVSLLVPQAGELGRGSVQLASSDVAGWYGIKTHWLVKPSYRGWVVVRAEELDRSAPVAALGEAEIGPVVIPPGPTPNTFEGWRQQPSGTYVKGPGCFGFQIDGTTFQEHLILRGVLPSG